MLRSKDVKMYYKNVFCSFIYLIDIVDEIYIKFVFGVNFSYGFGCVIGMKGV